MWGVHGFSFAPARLLAFDSGNKKLQEAVGIDFDTNLGVGRDLIDRFNYIVIAAENVSLHRATTIGDSFTAGKIATGLDVDMHFR